MAFLSSIRSAATASALLLIVVAILAGGASRAEVPGWLAVTIVALGAVVWLVWVTPPGALAIDRGALWFAAACVAVPLIQLVPLPFAIWSNLPGRALEVAAFKAAGLDGWLPISTTPGRTLLAVLGLIAPFCAFLITAQLDLRGRQRVIVVIVALALASALLGLLQVAGGEDSALRFFRVTANDAGVGFFANPNHQATLLMAAVPLAVVAFIERLPRRGLVPPPMIAALAAVIVFLAVGMLLTWSRAGLVFLAIVTVGGILLLPDLLPDGRRRLVTERRLLVVGALAICGLVALGMATLGSDAVEDAVREQGGARLDNVPVFLRIALDFIPFGSGLGSFDPVFRTYETLDMVNPRYLNQAHNEPAQLLIEAGLFGAALMLGFALWWGRRALDAWRAQPADLEVTLRRAATLSASLFLIHSFVDYPLRTPSAAVVFAVLCALMLPANTRSLRQDRARR